MILIRPGGLIIAHNMNARQADPRFLKEITTNPDFETEYRPSAGYDVLKTSHSKGIDYSLSISVKYTF